MAPRKLRSSGMSRKRAAKFPKKARSDFIEWDVRIVQGAVHVDIKPPDGPATQMRLNPDDAYDFKADIEQAIDQAIGI